MVTWVIYVGIRSFLTTRGVGDYLLLTSSAVCVSFVVNEQVLNHHILNESIHTENEFFYKDISRDWIFHTLISVCSKFGNYFYVTFIWFVTQQISLNKFKIWNINFFIR